MARPLPNRTPAHQTRFAERRRAAVEMKIGGKTWREIADTLGYDSRATAYGDVMRGLQKAVAELSIPLEEYRQLELDRLDAMQDALWVKVLDGDTKAIDTTLRLMDRRAKLLGLDAPQRMEGVLTIDAIDAAITDLSQQVAAARSETGEAR